MIDWGVVARAAMRLYREAVRHMTAKELRALLAEIREEELSDD